MKSGLLTSTLGCVVLTLAMGAAKGEDAAQSPLETLRAQEFWRADEGRKLPVTTGAAALELARGQVLIFDEDPTKGGLAYRHESAAATPGVDPTTLPAVVEEVGAYWRIERWVLLPTLNETNRNFFRHHREVRKTQAWFHLKELVGQDGSYLLLSAEQRDRPADWDERRLAAIYAGMRERDLLEWRRANFSRRWVEEGPEQPYLLDLGMHDELHYTYPPGMPPRVVHASMRPHDKNVPMTEAERAIEAGRRMVENVAAAGGRLSGWEFSYDLGLTDRRSNESMDNSQSIRFERAVRNDARFALTLNGAILPGASLTSEADTSLAQNELPDPGRYGPAATNGNTAWREASHSKNLLGWDAAGITVHVTAEAGVRVGTR